MKKVLEVLKKIGAWICEHITNSIEIATVITLVFLAINFNNLSKFSLGLICAILGILIYNIVKK